MKEIYIRNNEISDLIINFNGKEISLYYFVQSYRQKQTKAPGMVEILPSIYCNAVLNTKRGWKKILHKIKVYFDEADDYIIYVKNQAA